MLKRGDRVQLIRAEHVAGLLKGAVGTVLRDHDLGGEAVTVSFDGFTKGHWADGLINNSEAPSAWYVMLRDIETITEETANESNAHCETSGNETANLELQKDADGSRPAHASTGDAQRHVRQGTQRRGNDGPKRNH